MEIFCRCPISGPGRQFRFYDEPGFKKFVMGKIIEQNQKIQGLVQNGFSTPTEIGPVAYSLGEYPHHFQNLEHLAHRSMIDLKLLCKIALCRKPRSRSEV